MNFETKNTLHNNYQVMYKNFAEIEKENKFWNNNTFNKLRKAMYDRFKDYTEEEWEVYKNLNDIKEGYPKKLEFCWETAFYKEGINEKNGLSGSTKIDLEYHDEDNKVIIIKDPILGISWDYDEPKEGSWISIPEKLAEKLLMIESFKN